MKEPCCVADQFCTAAANFTKPDARAECFYCGQKVCRECSSKRKYLSYGVVRLCNNCQVDIDGNDNRVMSRLYRKAGYSGKKRFRSIS